jgi:acyl carrier protein
MTLAEVGVDVEAVVAAVEEVLAATQADPEPVNANTRLDTLGLDSLDFAELFVSLEEAGGGEIDPQSTAGIATVGELTRLQRL